RVRSARAGGPDRRALLPPVRRAGSADARRAPRVLAPRGGRKAVRQGGSARPRLDCRLRLHPVLGCLPAPADEDEEAAGPPDPAGAGGNIGLLSISVDPERDTPQKLKEYGQTF